MHWASTYLKISFLGQKLWPPAIKRFIFETPFEGLLLPCETDQVPYLCHFSSDQDEIWCAKAPWVAIDLYRISSSSAKNWLRVLCFLLYRLHLHSKGILTFLDISVNISLFLVTTPNSFFMGGKMDGWRSQRSRFDPPKNSNFWRKMVRLFEFFFGKKLKSNFLNTGKS